MYALYESYILLNNNNNNKRYLKKSNNLTFFQHNSLILRVDSERIKSQCVYIHLKKQMRPRSLPSQRNTHTKILCHIYFVNNRCLLSKFHKRNKTKLKQVETQRNRKRKKKTKLKYLDYVSFSIWLIHRFERNKAIINLC